MKDKLKKYLLPNLPYLFFVYLFDKLCQTVRLAPGLDASEKLLHIGQGFQAAFVSSAPSFRVLDICVGTRTGMSMWPVTPPTSTTLKNPFPATTWS